MDSASNEPPTTALFDPAATVPLGRTNVEVTRMAIGTVPLSGLFESVPYEEAVAVVAAAWEAEVRLFDVAPLYGYGFAERVVGDVLRNQPRDSYALSTKVGRLLLEDGPPERKDTTVLYQGTPRFKGDWPREPFFDFTYEGVMRSIEGSQERLGIERFDILHIHDPELFMDEAMAGAYRALEALRTAGVVGAIGVGSNHWETHLEFVRHTDIDCILLAGRYTLLDQTALAELLPLCEQRGVAVIAAGVYNSGILSHPDPGAVSGVAIDPDAMPTWKDNVTYDYEPADPEIIHRAARIKAVCDGHDVPLMAAAVQFPLHHPAVSCVLIGPRAPHHAAVNNAMMRVAIPDALWADLKREGLLPPQAPLPGGS